MSVRMIPINAIRAPRKRRPAKKPGYPSMEDLLAVQLAGYRTLPEWTRQFAFAAEIGRKFTSDFGWPQLKLLVEVQGGIWRKGGGAHSHPTRLLEDIAKFQAMAYLGYLFLPVTTDQVRDGSAVVIIVRTIIQLNRGLA